MPQFDSAIPVGDGDYIVQQGECLGSIAFENGLIEESLWNHPRNAALRAGRSDRKVLFPGDRVHVPAIQPRDDVRPTDCTHKFVLKGVTETLRIVLKDEHGKPRPSLPYIILVEGKRIKKGVTSSKGIIEASIRPNARQGKLIVKDKRAEEHYDLELGGLDPISTNTGCQARLNNLGFYCGDVDGIIGRHTSSAIREFQDRFKLNITGQLDDSVRACLLREHGF